MCGRRRTGGGLQCVVCCDAASMFEWKCNTAIGLISRWRWPPVVLAWAVGVFLLTGIGVAVLWLLGINLQTLGPSSPKAGQAIVAIELTAYAPTLSALLVVWLVPGGGGVRRLLGPILRWRIGLG